MKKNLLSVSQLASSRNYVVFGPDDVKVFRSFSLHGKPIMEGQNLESIYVIITESAYTDKTKKNETTDLWHAQLRHVSYQKLKNMMVKSILKGLSKLEIHDDIIYAGCQYGKAYQLPYKESECKAKEPLELILSNVFDLVKDTSISVRYMVTFIDDYSRKITEFLMQSGDKVTPTDSSLFVKAKGDKLAIVLVYADGLIIKEYDKEESLQTRGNLSVHFQMKELREIIYFLGLEVERTNDGLFLYQRKYTKDLLEKFGMMECEPISTPMEINARLYTEEGKDLEDTTMYRQLVGSLIYLTMTRPDISLAVGVVSCFMQNLKKPHVEVVRRILRYIKGTVNFGFMYKKGGACKIIGY
ncbi:hypothetical protein GH714_031358 [Hevea brasiliensis]|uniref:Reverse transcriptase Ty1/copia-type domain-containing protein n=1 Tax=Hevea brasiliensis TaxID=3981 RepID=A0A6A6M228_HEVBR|nr:hypothetical protein GH714_031358 [Hevea brasiliensis]